MSQKFFTKLTGLFLGCHFSYTGSAFRIVIELPGKDAPFVKCAFEQMATGAYAIDDLRKMVNGKGLKVSRNAFWCLLRHPVYIAKMKVPAYKGEPEMIVTAKHPAIVSDALFYEVQEVLDGKRRIKSSDGTLETGTLAIARIPEMSSLW